MSPHGRPQSRAAVTLALALPLALALLLALARPARAHEGDQSYFVNATLRCCTLPEPPIIIENINAGSEPNLYGFGGIAIKYLNLLTDMTGLRCSSLVKFEHDTAASSAAHDGNEFDHFVTEMSQCTVSDGEFGVINASNPSCTCDIGIGGWAINEKRLGLASFLPPFVSDNFMVVTHVDNTIPDAGVFFLRTFDFDVWITIFALLAVFTMLKFLDSDFSPWRRPRDDHTQTGSSSMRRFLTKGRVPFRLRKALQSTIGHMTGAPNLEIDGEYGTFRQGLLNFIIFLCGLFLVLIYGSSMTASIVQESFGSDYRDINDFKLCRIPTKDVCLVGGDGVELFWNMSIARLECHREEGWTAPRVFLSEQYMDGLEAASNGSCKYVVGLGSTLRYGIQRGYCGRLVFTGEPFFAEGVSFVLPQRSNLTFPLSKATLALKNADSVQTVLDFFEDDDDCLPERPKSLTFKKLRWFFFLAYGACVLLFFAMVLDRRREKADPDADAAPDPEAAKRTDPGGAAAEFCEASGPTGQSQPSSYGKDSNSGELARVEGDDRRGSTSTMTSQPASRDVPPSE